MNNETFTRQNTINNKFGCMATEPAMPQSIHGLAFNQPGLKESSNYCSRKEINDYKSLLMTMPNENTPAANEPSRDGQQWHSRQRSQNKEEKDEEMRADGRAEISSILMSATNNQYYNNSNQIQNYHQNFDANMMISCHNTSSFLAEERSNPQILEERSEESGDEASEIQQMGREEHS